MDILQQSNKESLLEKISLFKNKKKHLIFNLKQFVRFMYIAFFKNFFALTISIWCFFMYCNNDNNHKQMRQSTEEWTK